VPSALGRGGKTIAGSATSNGSSNDAADSASAGADSEATPGTFAAAIDGPDEAPSSSVLRPKASPSTRRLAAEAGVDLTRLTGSGPGGRILAADVEAAALAPAADPLLPAAAAAGAVGIAAATQTTSVAQASPPDVSVLQPGHHPLRGIRRATARAMDHSWSTIPHVTTMDEVDASELLLARQRIREALGDGATKVTPLALMVTAVARALRTYPVLNATLDLDAETIDVHNDINIGIAVASARGLMVPIIRNADALSIVGVAAEIARLSASARDGSIGAQDLAGGTCTVTNYGSNGGYFAAPIIRPGESAIVGFGAIAERPIVVDGEVVARPVLPVVVSADHRLIDGDVLSAFQANLSASLTNAVSLLVTNN